MTHSAASNLSDLLASIEDLYRAREDDAALDELEVLRDLAPMGSDARRRYYYFKIYVLGFHRYEVATALPLSESALREYPDDGSLWFLRGRLLELSGCGPTALEAFQRSAELSPDSPAATDQIASIHRRDGLYRRSEPGTSEPGIGQAALRTCQGVFLIVGGAYCGSTLLNMLIGAHPLVAGGGELHWLTHVSAEERSKEGICSFCGEACRVWSERTRANITLDNVYDETARAFGRPFVCDTSKTVEWSRLITPFTRSKRVRVLLVKHPLRHASSYVEKARRWAHLRQFTSIDTVLQHQSDFYREARTQPFDVILRYEDLVADPRNVLSPVLERMGLDYEPSIDAWQSVPHHDIGGNGGPRVGFSSIELDGDFRRRKYRRLGIFRDDTFAEVLSSDEIKEVLAHPGAKAICDEFGYELQIALDSGASP